MEEQGPLVVTRAKESVSTTAPGKKPRSTQWLAVAPSLGFFKQPPRSRCHQANTPSWGFIIPSPTHDRCCRHAAEKLVELTGNDCGKTFLRKLPGQRANETMVKLAWVYHSVARQTTKRKVIARDALSMARHRRRIDVQASSLWHREFDFRCPASCTRCAPRPIAAAGDEDEACLC